MLELLLVGRQHSPLDRGIDSPVDVPLHVPEPLLRVHAASVAHGPDRRHGHTADPNEHTTITIEPRSEYGTGSSAGLTCGAA